MANITLKSQNRETSCNDDVYDISNIFQINKEPKEIQNKSRLVSLISKEEPIRSRG